MKIHEIKLGGERRWDKKGSAEVVAKVDDQRHPLDQRPAYQQLVYLNGTDDGPESVQAVEIFDFDYDEWRCVPWDSDYDGRAEYRIGWPGAWIEYGPGQLLQEVAKRQLHND